jgi:hypothetical protein
MNDLFQLLIFSTIGVILIWGGYKLYGQATGRTRAKTAAKTGVGGRERRAKILPQVETGNPGDPRVCPVCSAKLKPDERVKSAAFPGLPGQGRLMHIAGCVFCLDGSRTRKCPVCGAELTVKEILVARMFEKPGRSHVHVLGCSHCREALASGA